MDKQCANEEWDGRTCALAGKDLDCWCAEGAPCHADVLPKYAARCAGGPGSPVPPCEPGGAGTAEGVE
ncbi:DUF4326 domain-containing protein [Roseibium sp.]|uniref:DUF4326 domain-containing protein n=1 Tax=Roseibium sp. TaxID=1936156 RepID=UPI003BA98965